MKLRQSTRTLLVALALTLAIAATMVLLVAPFYSGVRATAVEIPGRPESPPPVIETRSATLVEVNGAGVLGVLALPVALPALVLAAGRSRFRRPACAAGALLLVGFCLLTGFSIGLFYVPAALTMVAAALTAH